MTMHLVTIQHDVTNDRFHPTYYTLAPMPGPGPDSVHRYKSRGHHTEGFATLAEAEREAHKMGRELGCDEDAFEVRAVESPGADIAMRVPVRG